MSLRSTSLLQVGPALGLLAALFCAPVAAREPLTPAELPPRDYRGQQYVDSRGCMFLRAGTDARAEWIPRVTRDGVPLCGNPPSGKRVPIVGEAGAGAVLPDPEAADDAASPPPTTPDLATPEPAKPETAKLASGHLVAVGSFAVPENAERALARLKALNYPVAQGRMAGADGPVTIFAGPFATAEDAARATRELRGAGFPDAIQFDL